MNRMSSLFALLALFCLGACTGLSSSNVGEPSGYSQRQFQARVDRVHAGMPLDSLTLLFSPAEAPGELGILHKSRLVTEKFERETYRLGWISEPRHQTGSKDLADIAVTIAVIEVENGRVLRVERLD